MHLLVQYGYDTNVTIGATTYGPTIEFEKKARAGRSCSSGIRSFAFSTFGQLKSVFGIQRNQCDVCCACGDFSSLNNPEKGIKILCVGFAGQKLRMAAAQSAH